MTDIFSSMLRTAAPILLAALGGLLCEKAGVLNLALEGMMLFGAFFGVMGSYYTDNAYLGVLIALLSGAVLGMIYNLFVERWKADAMITSIGMNSLALGMTSFLKRSIFGDSGIIMGISGIPKHNSSFLSSIPVIGKILDGQTTLVYVGFPEDETYGLIKAISKKDHNLISGIKDRFINGFIEKTGSEENAYRVWQIIEDASAYGFNSSHALSVAYDSLYGAYLKSHYPLQYYAVTLNLYENDQDITALLTSELPYFNIELSDIKFGFSKSKYTYDLETMTIYKGMKSIKYLNEKVSDELYELSKNNYNDPIELFVDIVEKTSCNARQIKILIMLNFFSEFGEGKYLLNLFELINKRYDKKYKDKTKQARLEEIRNTEIVKEEFKPSEIIAAQKEYLGYATYKDEIYNPLVGVITDISNQYATRWMEIYFVKNGKTRQFKIKYSIIQELELKTGDMIYIKDFEKRPRKKLINGKWVNGDVQDFHITNIVKV